MKKIISFVLILAIVFSLMAGMVFNSNASTDVWESEPNENPNQANMLNFNQIMHGNTMGYQYGSNDDHFKISIQADINFRIKFDHEIDDTYGSGWCLILYKMNTSNNSYYDYFDNSQYSAYQYNYYDKVISNQGISYSPVIAAKKGDTFIFRVMSEYGGKQQQNVNYMISLQAEQQSCQHTFNTSTTKTPTCTETGTKEFICSKCGYNYTQTVSALGHNYIGSITQQPSCNKIGYKSFTCSRCSDNYTIALDALGHDYIVKAHGKAIFTNHWGAFWIPAAYICTKCNAWKIDEQCFPGEIKLSAKKYTYDGTVKNPKAIVLMNDNDIGNKNYYYTLESGRKNVGKYEVFVSLRGNYIGSETLYFTIIPKGTILSSLSAGKKSFNAKWKKQTTQTTGYQIQYSTNSNFSGAKLVTIKNNKILSKTIKGLAAKKTYYVRIRTYKTISSTHYMSNWSKSYKVKTK